LRKFEETKLLITAGNGFIKPLIHLYLHTVIFPLFRGGCLGVAWGLPGGFEGVRRGVPLRTPSKHSIKALRFRFLLYTDGG